MLQFINFTYETSSTLIPDFNNSSTGEKYCVINKDLQYVNFIYNLGGTQISRNLLEQ